MRDFGVRRRLPEACDDDPRWSSRDHLLQRVSRLGVVMANVSCLRHDRQDVRHARANKDQHVCSVAGGI